MIEKAVRFRRMLPKYMGQVALYRKHVGYLLGKNIGGVTVIIWLR